MERKPLTKKETKIFREKIYGHYRLHGRDFPWRRTTSPYQILVSEMMLQQTQVERVVRKYQEFVSRFIDFDALVRASLSDVLSAWQGLGYNRRAVALKRIAEVIVSDHGGQLPKDLESLSNLPGIGKTTAGEILAFAFNIPVPFIETNIRRVFIHEFFDGVDAVEDSSILPLVEATLDRKNPRQWYWALMDYGSTLKKSVTNPNRRSAHYSRQPPFEGSDRRIRGILVRALLGRSDATVGELESETSVPQNRLNHILVGMTRDGIIREKNGKYSID